MVGYAHAGAGAPVPEGSQTPQPTRKDKATPFVVIFEMVDTHKEGKISQAEFTAGWARAGFRSLTSRPI